jgi:hypothetical protein
MQQEKNKVANNLIQMEGHKQTKEIIYKWNIWSWTGFFCNKIVERLANLEQGLWIRSCNSDVIFAFHFDDGEVVM